MPACALCENDQASGEACEVCGHPFAPGQRIPVVFDAMEGLEPTSLPPATAAGERVPDLDPTGVDPVQVVVSAMEDLQPTEVEGVPEDGPPDDPLAPGVCRYCRNPAPPGEAFCVHCGMRLPTQQGRVEALLASVLLCRDCGTPVKGSSCPGCGARVQG